MEHRSSAQAPVSLESEMAVLFPASLHSARIGGSGAGELDKRSSPLSRTVELSLLIFKAIERYC